MLQETRIVNFLQQQPLIGDLPVRAIQAIVRHGEQLFFNKRQWVIRQQEIEDLYFILEGTIVRCHERPFQVIAINEMLGEGMHFGDIFFAGGAQSIRALSDCLILRLEKSIFENFLLDAQENFLEERLAVVSFLDNLQLIHGMSPSNRIKLSFTLDIICTQQDEIILHQGDFADNMYSILSGSFQVEKDQRILAELSHQDTFGEMGIFLQQPRTATVRSMNEGKLIQISRQLLDQIRSKNFHTEFAIQALTNRRLRVKA